MSTPAYWGFLTGIQESFEGNDLTGADIQEAAILRGLAHAEPYNPEKHGVNTHCEEGDGFIVLDVERYGI